LNAVFVGLSPSVFVSCMDYHCTIFFPCSFFALGVNVFCVDMVIADLCMYVGNSVVHLHICGVGLGWVWLLWCVNWFCQIMGLASRKNNKRRQRKVPSLQQPFTDSQLILQSVPLVVLIVFIPDLVSHSPFIFPWTLVYSLCSLFAEGPARQTQNHN